MPLLRNTDRSKISKRKNPAARLMWFHEQGYLPEALRNFLALMGYSMPDGQEVFSFDEMVESFDWARVNPVGPVFDLTKLDWLNGHYIRTLSVSDLASRTLPYLAGEGLVSEPASSEQLALLEAATPLIQDRIALLSEVVPMLGFFFVSDADFAPEPEAVAKAFGLDSAATLDAALAALDGVGEWRHDMIKAALDEALVQGLGLKPKHAFTPLRVAITGRTISPPLFESMELLGRERSLARLRAAASIAG
jgi:glutamyl-tRNA synthetase